jgi:hypothetical protein
MSDPIAFPSATPVIGLPLLMAGQAQKEFFVNQALCLLDALHPRTVRASLAEPPAAPVDGESFRITAPAGGDWAGRENHIAVRIGGDWHFISPLEGMRLFDKGAGCLVLFRSEWQQCAAPAAPTGGAVIDVEARAAIAALTEALRTAGVLAPTSP